MSDQGTVNNFHCEKCHKADNERMVQCDKCDVWYHFDCVGVDSAIADASWSCDTCTPGENGADTAAANEPADNVQLGAASVNLLMQPQAASSPAGEEIVRNNRRVTTAPGSTAIFDTRVLNKNNIKVIPPGATQVQQIGSQIFNKPQTSTAAAGLSFQFAQQQQQRQQPTNHQSESLNMQCELQLKMLEEKQRIQQEFLEKKYQILSQFGQTESRQNISFNTMTGGPTASQLAARQAIPRDLPHFQGDPEEWPLFISSFETSTAGAGYSHAENLIRLQSCLKGRAKELVRSKLMMPAMVPEIIQTLKMCFGRPEHILERVIERARKLAPPKDKLEAIIDYALCVKNICSTMEACKMDAHLNNPMLVKELVDKLSSQYKLNWAMHLKDDTVPIVKTFSDWIFQIADAASSVVSTTPTTRNGTINTHTEDRPQTNIMCYVCNNSEHKVSACSEFKRLPLDKKWEIVKNHNLCRQCLNKHRRRCYLNNDCGIDNCTAKRHRLLHKHTTEQSVSIRQNNSVENNSSGSATINSHSIAEANQSSFFRILPVRLYKKNGFIDTFAFLDEGSSVTLIEKEVFDLLDVEGVNEPLCLKWTGETTRLEESSVKAVVHISSAQNNNQFVLKNVRTVQNLNLPVQSLNVDEVTGKYPYLAGIPLQSYENVKPAILIGVDNWKIAVPLKVREGSWNQPIATTTRLGWTIQGCSDGSYKSSWLNFHSCDCKVQDKELHQLVKEHFNLEKADERMLISPDDAKCKEIQGTTCQKIEGRYEVGLLWKNRTVQLPDSYNNALKELECLTKKFRLDESLKNSLQQQIDNLLIKGYARKVTEEEIKRPPGPVWYLPIFITKNPNKPDKIRLVWDAAAKSNGACLNDFIHSGPDLLKSLVDVLISFRVGRVAVCGDIAEMFHQINVRKDDMHCQRFLRADNEGEARPSIYVMKALTFGISCAPCIAHYVRDYNAEQFKEEYPRAVEAIQHYHYVDDFIDSVDNEHLAIELCTQVKSIHAAAGFHIRNWSSNRKVVLSYLQDDITAEQTPKDLSATPKVLGMYWDPNKDSFVYNFRFARLRRDVFMDAAVPTKRELLQVLMSICDPLGFLSCFTTTLKILLQEVWRSGTDWDAEIHDSLWTKWQKWKMALKHISAVAIPRCYSPQLSYAPEVELHTFVDAGKDAYAAVCYFRIVHQGKCTITIVAGKSKVAPLKPMSIPRLELQAAVAGVRLANKITQNRRTKITSQIFWSDSKTVLQWLRMDPRKFQQFVMHRVGEILESTDIMQWRWVPSKMNPADLSTKIQTQWEVSTWFSGPQFLHEDEAEWPNCNNFEDCSKEEMRHHTFIINKSENCMFINVKYFSNWRRLYRAVATFLLYLSRLKASSKKMPLPKTTSYEMIQQAKLALFRQAQESEFQEEIRCLKKRN